MHRQWDENTKVLVSQVQIPLEENFLLKLIYPSLPKFSQHPDTSSPDSDFKKELEHLPLKKNVGEVVLCREHQGQVIDHIYDYQDVFSV